MKVLVSIVLAVVLPCVSLASTQTFTNIRLVVSDGKKGKEVKARLVLADEHVQVQQPPAGGVLKELDYSDLKAATYSYSKHPRWKETIGLGIAIGVFALPLLFSKSKKHWMTLQAEGDHMALRLHKKNFAMIIAAVESQTGLSVERVAE